MTVAKLFTMLQRNFGEHDTVYVGINKKFHNERTGNTFGRDFEEIRVELSDLKRVIKKYYKDYDLYLCFTPISKGEKRLKNKAQDTYLIVQDIDGVEIPEDLPPSYYWETSPNKYQGVWILDNKVTPQEQEEINRKLITKYDFDKTGADIVHFYRIPSTYNNKYASTFKVSPLKGTGKVYRKKELMKALKDVKLTAYVDVVGEVEEIPLKRYDLEALLEQFGVETIYSKTEGIDRSSWYFSLGTQMFKRGASKEQVKFVFLNAPDEMSKFNGNQLDAEVYRLEAKASQEDEEEGSYEKLVKKDIPIPRVSDLKKKGKKAQGLSIVNVSDIEPYDDKDFWLIEDFWQNSSVGIVGAPPKAFKSTFTLNLACSVATGKSFDGRKVKQGSVLIVQAENSLSMEQSKIYAITGETELPIYFVESNWDLTKVMQLKEFILEHDVKLVIIDPMYLLFGAGDINKHQDISQRLSQLTKLRDATGCSIMLVHHSRKLERGSKIQTSDMYGSAFIEGWYESMILLQRKGAQNSRMTTYFRNHKSGDVYNLVVDDNMGCKAYKLDTDDWSKQEASIDSILPKEGSNG